MYSINSCWLIKLAVESPDNDLWLCPPLLYVFGCPLCCYHGSGSVLFYDFIQEGLWSVENACTIQVLASAGAGFCLWCFCECQIWGGGEGRGARSRKGSGIVFPCSKQNNLCVIISVLIVCWGSAIPRIGAQLFSLRGMGGRMWTRKLPPVCESAAVRRDYRNIWVIGSRKSHNGLKSVGDQTWHRV